ncbi:MAG: DUF262 domain-containing protein [Bacteroidales bacterium]|nr:DUF262 domain-containing protein [Bacteroidales bacterium]
MDIELRKISVRKLTEGYVNNDEEGVRAYDGKLDIRPPYQREFIYKDEQQKAVINTIMQGFPLNTMYWAEREDGTWEIIDGQQRTLSICQFVSNKFNIDDKTFGARYYNNLQEDEQKKILDYELTVYICKGKNSEKLRWFETINIAGEKLTKQELRNAVYSGPFVTDAKRFFSRTGCAAFKRAVDYINGTPIRQDYLETVIEWHARAIGEGTIEDYMGKHQKDINASQLKAYFNAVVDWVDEHFDRKKWKKIMKGLDWGLLYDKYHGQVLDTTAMDEEIGKLMIDSEVQKKSGIIPYVLTRDEHYLGLRAFPEDIRLAVYTKQGGVCPECKKHFDIKQMDADHIVPWAKGGKTVEGNCQMLCMTCNRRKGKK